MFPRSQLNQTCKFGPSIESQNADQEACIHPVRDLDPPSQMCWEFPDIFNRARIIQQKSRGPLAQDRSDQSQSVPTPPKAVSSIPAVTLNEVTVFEMGLNFCQLEKNDVQHHHEVGQEHCH